MSPSTRASATAGLVTLSTRIKEIYKVEMIQMAFYSLNPESKARILSEVMEPSLSTGTFPLPLTLYCIRPPAQPCQRPSAPLWRRHAKDPASYLRGLGVRTLGSNTEPETYYPETDPYFLQRPERP